MWAMLAWNLHSVLVAQLSGAGVVGEMSYTLLTEDSQMCISLISEETSQSKDWLLFFLQNCEFKTSDVLINLKLGDHHGSPQQTTERAVGRLVSRQEDVSGTCVFGRLGEITLKQGDHLPRKLS